MPETYQLPCNNCDAFIPVSPQMAGRTFNCELCQSSVEVPTMREIRRLEPVQDNRSSESVVRPKKSRNESRSWLFSGGLLLAGVTLLAAIPLWLYANGMQSESMVKQEIDFGNQVLDEATPGVIWNAWTQMTANGLPEWKESQATRYNKQGQILKNIAYGLGALSGLGLFMMIGSFLIPGRR